MKHRLTDTTVRSLEAPEKGNKLYFDITVPGFALRVTAAGSRSFVLNYRTRADKRERRITIGDIDTWSAVSARERARELKREVDAGSDPLKKIEVEREAPTVKALAARYIAEHLPKKRQRSRIEDERLLHFITDALGREKVADITYTDADRLHRKVTEDNGKFRANRVLALLSKMMSLAVKWRMRTDNPCKAVERNPEPKRNRYLTQKEIERLMAVLDEDEDQEGATILKLLLLTGARSSEVLKMEWSQLDLDGGVWTKPHTATKQKEEHIVPLGDEALGLLRNLRKNGRYVFGVFQPRKNVRLIWERVRVAAGIEDVRIHDLRHSYASLLVNAGYSLPVIGALLGHKTPSTTQRYAHVGDTAMRQATNVITLRRKA